MALSTPLPERTRERVSTPILTYGEVGPNPLGLSLGRFFLIPVRS